MTRPRAHGTLETSGPRSLEISVGKKEATPVGWPEKYFGGKTEQREAEEANERKRRREKERGEEEE